MLKLGKMPRFVPPAGIGHELLSLLLDPPAGGFAKA